MEDNTEITSRTSLSDSDYYKLINNYLDTEREKEYNKDK